MASGMESDADTRTALLNRRLCCLSHTPHPSFPNDGSPLASPRLPATPSNTPTTTTSSSPTRQLLCVPTTTPTNRRDSGFAGASGSEAMIEAHLPDLSKLHPSQSPIIWPSAPPNSPEIFALAGEAMNEPDHTLLGERLAALTLATSKKAGFSSEEMKILAEDVPKAPGE
jgi:hypothetical protein